jgi:hypothetical protein
MASLVPEPMLKWTVWAESPTSTTLSLNHVRFLTVTKFIHSDRLDSSGWPSRKSAKIFSQNSRDSSSDMTSRPERRQVSSLHSMTNVLRSSA